MFVAFDVSDIVLILVLMDNQNTKEIVPGNNNQAVLILVLMDNQNTPCYVPGEKENPES